MSQSTAITETASLHELRRLVQGARLAGSSVGLVPTMGALHDGHRQLARQSAAENDLTVMSIYVNPSQFGPNEDFERYPRSPERDRVLAGDAGVDLLFLPETDTMYPDGSAQQVWVDPGSLAEHLCGASRPGHFRGVATVVAKLFNMVQPDRAYFGQKDGQQAAVLTRMVHDLAFPVEVRVVPTVREPDGLALSSRNMFLLPRERRQAVALSSALEKARAYATTGGRDPHELEQIARDTILRTAPLARIDYVSVVELHGLQPIVQRLEGDAMLALAVYFGATRLIDNVILHFTPNEPRSS